jgi:inorganic pyrophosphatase
MHQFPRDIKAYRSLLASRFRWATWDALIEQNGLTIDRPARQPHPEYSTIIYPIDYGYVNDTVSSDGEPVDAFVGSAANGLVGLIATTDHRQHDREVKLLVDCAPTEVYTAHGFVNYDRTLLEGLLVLRAPMHTLWLAR